MHPIYSIPVNTIRGFEIHGLSLSLRGGIHRLRLRQLGVSPVLCTGWVPMISLALLVYVVDNKYP